MTGEMKSLSVTLNFCLLFALTDECFTLKFQMFSCYSFVIMGLLLPFSPGQYVFLRYCDLPETFKLCKEAKMSSKLVHFTGVK